MNFELRRFAVYDIEIRRILARTILSVYIAVYLFLLH